MTTREERVRNALTREELDSIHEPVEDFDDIGEYADANTEWYNEAVWTAARLFVEAAEESEKFSTDFVADVQREETIEYEDGESITIEVDAWRDTMQKEVPEYHEKVMGIGLSAFQGGSAEQVARSILTDES